MTWQYDHYNYFLCRTILETNNSSSNNSRLVLRQEHQRDDPINRHPHPRRPCGRQKVQIGTLSHLPSKITRICSDSDDTTWNIYLFVTTLKDTYLIFFIRDSLPPPPPPPVSEMQGLSFNSPASQPPPPPMPALPSVTTTGINSVQQSSPIRHQLTAALNSRFPQNQASAVHFYTDSHSGMAGS